MSFEIQKMSPLPLYVGEMRIKLTNAAPVSCPIRVTRLGSPPKDATFFFIHLKAAAISLIPRFPPDSFDLSKVGEVFKNPKRKIYFNLLFIKQNRVKDLN